MSYIIQKYEYDCLFFGMKIFVSLSCMYMYKLSMWEIGCIWKSFKQTSLLIYIYVEFSTIHLSISHSKPHYLVGNHSSNHLHSAHYLKWHPETTLPDGFKVSSRSIETNNEWKKRKMTKSIFSRKRHEMIAEIHVQLYM